MNEALKYKESGAGHCRHCDLQIAERDKRNLKIGRHVDGHGFVVAAILVTPSAFRCPNCFTRHQYKPFQPVQIGGHTVGTTA